MPKHIVFVQGEDEYKSETTMPALADELKTRYGMKTTVLLANTLSDIPGLDALQDADLAVFYMRFCTLPAEQLAQLDAYLNTSRPIVAFRTTTHAFRYPADSPQAHWNLFGQEIFGTPWRFHYGHASSTDTRVIPEKSGHPVLKGVETEFHVRSWLYYVLPLPETCDWLMMGHSVGESHMTERVDNPVAWTNTHTGSRVFYTSMGHPEDFQVEGFRRLVHNGIHWALDV